MINSYKKYNISKRIMSQKERTNKRSTEDLENELESLLIKRDYYKLKRKFEHAERRFEGKESKIAPPLPEEIEIFERIIAVRSVLYKRRK